MFKKFQKVKDIHGYRYAVSKFSWLSIYNLIQKFLHRFIHVCIYNLRIVKKKMFFSYIIGPQRQYTKVPQQLFIRLLLYYEELTELYDQGIVNHIQSCLLEFCFCHQLWFMFKSHDQLKYCAIFFFLAPVLVVLVNINLNHMHDFAQCQVDQWT